MVGDPIAVDTEQLLDGAGEDTSPHLDLAGFAGPLAQLLALARAQAIDLREISLAALLDQLATADAEDDIQLRPGLRRRSAWASTLLPVWSWRGRGMSL